MMPLLVALLLQAPQVPPPPVDLPVSLERVREGVLKSKGRFDLPAPRPWRRPLFRVQIRQNLLLETDPWEATSLVPSWVRPFAPTYHYEFLGLVTPGEARASTLHPCCNVTSVIGTVAGLVKKAVRAMEKANARREVERVMREAGIQKK